VAAPAARAPAPAVPVAAPPAAAAPVMLDAPPPLPELRPSVTAAAGAKTIMVVEDDPAIREMLVRSLGPEYNVYEASDGQQALEMLRRIKPAPDLLILDVMMPRMDGLSLAAKLKTEPQHLRSVPIIFLTGRDSPKDVVQGINVGARHYLTKPFKIQEIMAKVAKTLGTKK
jgi:DNA-binding response OmpR family regulator